MTRERLRSLRRNIDGSTALEFAIVGPVLVAFLVGIVSMGYALYADSAVRSAIQRSSRMLISNPSTTADAIKSNAQAYLAGLPIDDLTVLISSSSISGTLAYKTVSWTYRYPFSAPFVTSHTFQFGSSIAVPMAVAG